MSIDRALLARYLRQLADLGITEISFDDMTAREALDALVGRQPSTRSAPPSQQRPAAEDQPSPPSAPPARRPPAAAPHATQQTRAAGMPASAVPPQIDVGVTNASGTKQVVAPVRDAGAAPDVARRLAVLAEQAAGCTLCGLHAERSTVVFGEGSAAAQLVVVGEAPGQEEDRTGRPFVGRAGKLLDLLLQSVGFPRAEVYICNVLKCRPPGNRNPLPNEVTPCSTTFLHRQIEAIAPRVLLAVGKFAAQTLLESDASIGSLRGTVHTYRGTPLIATYHPAFLLRSPQMTRAAWQDYQLVRRVLDEQA